MTSLFVCPICGGALSREPKLYRCASGHSFDRAAQGYVHLLPANRKHSADPGDDREMVAARAAFLACGHYAPLRQLLCAAALAHCPEEGGFLDSGCGEGYYTEGICDALKKAGRQNPAAGIDISKAAAKLAARRCPDAEIAVASAYRLPVADRHIGLLLNCFSPLCIDEFRRVLQPGGRFLYVVPAPRHLMQLKELLYERPYENARIKAEYPGFRYLGVQSFEGSAFLRSGQEIQNLFGMTPYFWKTPRAGKERLAALDSLETEIGFDLHIYERL